MLWQLNPGVRGHDRSERTNRLDNVPESSASTQLNSTLAVVVADSDSVLYPAVYLHSNYSLTTSFSTSSSLRVTRRLLSTARVLY